MSRFNRGSPGKAPVISSATIFILSLTLILASPVSADVPDDVCAGCHPDVAEAFTMAPHGIYLSNEAETQYSCEACHGSATEHVEEGDPAKIINPADHEQFDGQILCLTCHKASRFDDWAFSSHAIGSINCGDCHSIHVSYEQAMKNRQPCLCYKCHSDVKAAAYMPSHHPIREGKLICGDCHDPHGGPARLTSDATGRELCFSCHGEMEGPFIYEHAPVNEDCLICHNPHGSVANNLLKQAEPALCLSCHPMHFHATVVSVDGDFTTPQAPERAGTSTSDAWKKGMLSKCTQCHSEVHGSDLPSQSISTGGNALTR